MPSKRFSSKMILIKELRNLDSLHQYYVRWKRIDDDGKSIYTNAWASEKLVADAMGVRLIKFWIKEYFNPMTSPDLKPILQNKLEYWSKTNVNLESNTGVSSNKRRRLESDREHNGIDAKKSKLINASQNEESNKSIVDVHISEEISEVSSPQFEFGDIICIKTDLNSNHPLYHIQWNYQTVESAETLGLKDQELIVARRALQRKRCGCKLSVIETTRLPDSTSDDLDLITTSTHPPGGEPESGENESESIPSLSNPQNLEPEEKATVDVTCQTDPYPCSNCKSKLVDGDPRRVSSLRQRKSKADKVDTVIESESSKKKKSKSKKENLENNDDEDLVEIEYEVEKILDYGKNEEKDRYEYFVRWKGYKSEDDTWEPNDNMANCDKAKIAFYVDRVVQRKSWETLYKTTAENSEPDQKIPQIPLLPPIPEIVMEILNKMTPLAYKEIEEAYKMSKNTPPSAKWGKGKLQKFMLGIISNSDNSVDEAELRQLRNQLLMLESGREKDICLMKLKAWEKQLNITTQGKPEIYVENKYDLCGPLENFTYVNDNKIGIGVKFPDDPTEGCACTTCDHKSSCCPSSKHGQKFAYSSAKRLKIQFREPIYECNKGCKCGPDCINRVVQDGTVSLAGSKLCIFRTSNGRGWGVKTLKKIKKGSFVCIYAGEIVTNDEAESRGLKYEREFGVSYLFDLDYLTANTGARAPYAIDATCTGNIARFINHSCDPNLRIFNVWVDCVDQNLPKLALFAMKDIRRGEELTYDYTPDLLLGPTSNEEPSGEVTTEDSSTNPDATSPPKKARRPCLCGASPDKCRRFIFER